MAQKWIPTIGIGILAILKPLYQATIFQWRNSRVFSPVKLSEFRSSFERSARFRLKLA